MQTIKLCFSSICLEGYAKSDIHIGQISKDIAKHPCIMTVNQIAENIAESYTFCPCTFTKPTRKQEFIEQRQLFVLDFDGPTGTKGACELTFNNALQRAERYKLPVAIVYETMSSVNYGRYRLVFVYNESITDIRMMELINRLLLCVFPEADQTTSDLAKMFYPGSNVQVLSDKTFCLDTLAIAAEAESRKHKNMWKNKLDAICVKTNVVTIGSSIKIGCIDDISQDEADFVPIKTAEIILCDDKIPPNSLENGFNSLLYNKDMKLETKKNRGIFFSKNMVIKQQRASLKKSSFYKQRIDIDNFECCSLLYQFCTGESRLQHSEWFGLMLNLIYINKGQTLFEDTLNRFSEMYGNVDSKILQMRYCIDHAYSPAMCDNFCPYASECNHKANVINTMLYAKSAIKKLNNHTVYQSLAAVRQEIRDEISFAASLSNTMTVIKTQTGIGKTTAALEYIKNSTKRVIMAFPNGSLMKEVYAKALNLRITVECTPLMSELDNVLTQDQYLQIQRCYDNGAPELPTQLLRFWSKENPEIQLFLDRYNKSRTFKGHLFTTHSRLMTMSKTLTEDDVVIIDEDISQQYVQMKYISQSELISLSKLMSRLSKDDIANTLNSIIKHIEKKPAYIKTHAISLSPGELNSIMKDIIDSGEMFSTCILGAICADYFYADSYSDNIFFAQKQDLPPLPSYIMMSATVDDFICNRLYSPAHTVRFHECSKVKYKGKVIINADKTYSRYCFKNNPELIHKISEKTPDDYFITFLDCIDDISTDDNHKLYFGRALGTNAFEGKNITIIGTPHKPAYIYHLFAQIIGFECKDTLSTRRVSANGFEFSLMTYADENLRRIQIYMINTDLEQAVGRARLIHCDCVVNVYSGFPVEMADINDKAAGTNESDEDKFEVDDLIH